MSETDGRGPVRAADQRARRFGRTAETESGTSEARGDSTRRTSADLAETSTTQQIESPGSSSSTVATGCGTVVLRESEAGEALNAFDSNERATVGIEARKSVLGHKCDLPKGLRIDLKLKYLATHGSIDRSMTGTRGRWDRRVDGKAIRVLSTRRSRMRKGSRLRFEVPSEDGARKYEVAIDDSGWSCTCPDWADRRAPCGHIVALTVWLDPNPPPIGEDDSGVARPTYSQVNWPAYDRAQQLEHLLFDKLLWDLLGIIPERPRPIGKRGRPAIPLRTEILMSVRKVHFGESLRRAHGLMVALNSDGKGILNRVPNYAVPSRFFNLPVAPIILLKLIEASGSILNEIEDKGTVAIDSSGFCTSCRGAYLTETHDPDRRHIWLNAHLAVGTVTNVVLSAVVTDGNGADSPNWIPLLRRVRAAGSTAANAVGDKAYLARDNLAEAERLGFDPFVPFKINSRSLSKAAPIWNRKWHEFMARRDEFDEAYHQRSNVESTFSAIKRKLGEPLLSRNQFARFSELLAKILAYNIGVVIKQSELHGFHPGPIGFPSTGTPPPPEPIAVAA
jgi:hypothetical protein